MDPDETLKELLALARELQASLDAGETLSEPADDAKVSRLVELALALDTWLRRGGYLPSRWTR